MAISPWLPPGHERFRTGKPTTDVLAADPNPVWPNVEAGFSPAFAVSDGLAGRGKRPKKGFLAMTSRFS
jgi:hypothetical protein